MPTAIRGKHVLRGRHVRRRHDAFELHRAGGVRDAVERAQLITRLEHRPAHREPPIAYAPHGAPMGVVHRVRGHDLAACAAIALDAPLQWTPRAVQLVARGVRVVVYRLTVVVDDVGTRVGERPRHVPVEPDHHRRGTWNGDAIDVERAGHHDVRLVPDRRQRELQVRIAGEEGMATRGPPGRHRPVVAGHRPRRVLRVAPPTHTGRHEDACGREQHRSGGIGCSRWRKRLKVHARRGLPIGLDGFLNGRVVWKQRLCGPRSHARCGGRAIVLHREVRQRVSHAVEQVIRIDGAPHRGMGAGEPELQWQLGSRHLPHIRIHAVGVRGHEPHERRRIARCRDGTLRRARKTQPAHLAIQWQRAHARDLREPSGGGQRLHIELKEPVARHHVAEPAIGILLCRGEDVWHRALVVHHFYRGTQAHHWCGGCPRQLGRSRQRPHAVRRFEKRTEGRRWPDAARADGQQTDEHDECAGQPR